MADLMARCSSFALRSVCPAVVLAAIAAVSLSVSAGDFSDAETAELKASLKALGDVYSDAEQQELRGMLRADIRQRLQAANDRSSEAWRSVDSAQDWQRFVNDRRVDLARVVGRPFLEQKSTAVEAYVTKTIDGDGFKIDNVVFDSRDGLWITANVYRPAKPTNSMPGIVLCHSHHTPKTHGELQDMGMTWARLGCLVIVPDHFGHGERSTHPFRRASDFPREFRVSRQDYYFRYDNGIQLLLAGETLVGQLAWDLRRSADYLLSQDGVDPQRLIVLGAVAGGGDPCAVAAFLDRRFAAAVPFNFGGPQPETRYPLPEDAETSFNYAGGGSWESTRNIAGAAGTGCLPWVIVGGIAPRKLVFSHEFNWDRPRDPVWKRLQRVYQLHGKPENLAYTFGRGEVTLRPPNATHCTHIGKHHRQRIHEAFEKWFGISNGADNEYSERVDSSQLACLTDDVRRKIVRRPLRETLAAESAAEAAQRDEHDRWRQTLGVMPTSARAVRKPQPARIAGGVTVHPLAVEAEAGLAVPLVLLTPPATPAPAVIVVAQEGKARLLAERTDEIVELLAAGVAVCLADVRGTGETRPGDGRTRRSAATSLSSTELMLGGTLVGGRLRDLIGVAQHLRSRRDIDGKRLAVWGESLAPANPADTNFAVPRGIDGRPRQSEPVGGLLAVFAGVADDRLRAAYVRGGLLTFGSVLDSPFVQIPHDVVLPRILADGDLDEAVAQAAPMPIRFHRTVDGLNRLVAAGDVMKAYHAAKNATAVDGEDSAAQWLIEQLKPARD